MKTNNRFYWKTLTFLDESKNEGNGRMNQQQSGCTKTQGLGCVLVLTCFGCASRPVLQKLLVVE